MNKRVYYLFVAALMSVPAAGAQDFLYSMPGASAATGNFGYNTETSWQGAIPQSAPGSSDAGLGNTFRTGPQGWQDTGLPECTTGLQAQGSGYSRPAVRQFGSGGFSGGGARPYMGVGGGGFGGGGMLPPCSMTPCDFDVTSGLGGSPCGNGGTGGMTEGGGGCGGGGGGGGGGSCDSGGCGG